MKARDIIPGYCPYQPSPWLSWLYWTLELPKEKPNVGYWPRGTSTSKGNLDSDWRWFHWRACFNRPLTETDEFLYRREFEENFAYHRHQQHITDEFRAKTHFANRILVQRAVTLSDYHEWNANFPEMRGNW